MWRLPLSFIMQDKNSFNVKKMVRSKGIEEEEIELVFAVNSNDIVIFVVKELQIHLGKYLICSYVNKELEVSEMKEIEDKLNRKTSSVDYEVKRPRKYSSIDDKIKDN